jgi:hypothetical protein
MPTDPTVIIEADYESLDEAMATKDAQTAQLDAQGIPFQQTTLYGVWQRSDTVGESLGENSRLSVSLSTFDRCQPSEVSLAGLG